MSISVIAPLEPAFRRMRRILFEPFDAGKWFTLGFCAFLASLSDGFGGGFSDFNSIGSGPSTGISDHPAIVVAAILAGLSLMVVLIWLGSRGKLMFIDGVSRNRGAVSEPWNQFREQGNSLFAASLVLMLVGLAAIAVLAIPLVLLAWSDIQNNQFGPGAMAALLIGGPLGLAALLALAFAHIMLNQFVVAIMYHRNLRCGDACRVFVRDLLRPHLGVFVLYCLMCIPLLIAAGLLALIVIVATCCIAALPYLSAVALLPISVFMRCYSIELLQQFGGEWWRYRDTPEAICPMCGYDLRGNPATATCPECGAAIHHPISDTNAPGGREPWQTHT